MFRYRYGIITINSPPAPLALVHVAVVGSDDWVRDIPALIDSGADITVLPDRVVESLRLIPVEHVPATSFDGHTTPRPLFIVQLVVRDFPPVEVQVLGGIHAQYVILGRDMLNQFRIVLDGPNQRVDFFA